MGSGVGGCGWGQCKDYSSCDPTRPACGPTQPAIAAPHRYLDITPSGSSCSSDTSPRSPRRCCSPSEISTPRCSRRSSSCRYAYTFRCRPLLPSYPPYGTFIVLMQAPFMTCAFCLAQSPPPRGRSPTYPPTYQPTCSCRVPPRAPTRTSGASCVNCSTRRPRALSRTLSTDPDPNPSLALAS